MSAFYSKLTVNESVEKLIKARREGDSALANSFEKELPVV